MQMDYSTQWLARWPQNEKLGPMFVGSKLAQPRQSRVTVQGFQSFACVKTIILATFISKVLPEDITPKTI